MSRALKEKLNIAGGIEMQGYSELIHELIEMTPLQLPRSLDDHRYNGILDSRVRDVYFGGLR